MALKILIADADSEDLSAYCDYFKQELYEVERASTGREVQLKLYQEKFFALIMNWSIQNHSAAQVLSFTKKNYPQLKVIIIVNDSVIFAEGSELTQEDILKWGASELFLKPFEKKDLKAGLEGHQDVGQLIGRMPHREGVSPEEEIDGKDSDYSAVVIDEFFSGKVVLFDVYIRLRENRYVKILHAGDSFSKERILRYRDEKHVQYLYFHNKDRRKFIQFNNYLAEKMVVNEKINSHTKVGMLKNISAQYLEEVHVEGLKPQILEQGKEISDSVYRLVETDKKLYSLLKNLNDFDPTSYTHSFLVTLYATSISKQFDWQCTSTIQAMSLACLLHDIGKTKLPKELLNLPKDQMTAEQKELYESHPILGLEIVESNKLVNNTVKQVILQHHEAYDGSGYPNHLRGSRILLMANVVCLVDDFVHLMIEKGISPIESLKTILSNKEMVARYHSSILENFIKVFVDPDKIVKDKILPSNSKILNKKVS